MDYDNLINAIKGKLELLKNKTTVIGTQDYSSDTESYPTVYAIQTWVRNIISSKADIEDIPTELSQLGSDNDHQLVSSSEKETWNNKASVDTATTEKDGLMSSGDKTKLNGIATGATKNIIDTSLSDNSKNAVQNKVIHAALNTKANDSELATVAKTGNYSDLAGKPSLSSLGGVVTVEKQTTADTGYNTTYIVKQNGTQVGSKINIPKDYLVKSASVKTCSTANNPVTGYVVGDKYMDFVINTKDSTGSDEHLYVKVSDLIDTYTADNVTLLLSDHQFKIKDGGVDTNQLKNNAVTKQKLETNVQNSLGYADTFNASACKGITSTQINNWNNIFTNGVTNSALQEIIDELADEIEAIS